MEDRGGLKATVGNRVTTYHFIHIVFCSFLCLPARVFVFFMAGQHASTYWTLWAQRTYLHLFNSHCYSSMKSKTNLRIIKTYQNTQAFVGNNYLVHYTISLYLWSPSDQSLLKKIGLSLHPGSNIRRAPPVTTAPTPNPLSYCHWHESSLKFAEQTRDFPCIAVLRGSIGPCG